MSENGANLSWGSDKDHDGKIIDANSTELKLPTSATDADVERVGRTLNLDGCDKVTATATAVAHIKDRRVAEAALATATDRANKEQARADGLQTQLAAETGRADTAEAALEEAEETAADLEAELQQSNARLGRADRGLQRLRALHVATRAELRRCLLDPQFLFSAAPLLKAQEQARAGILHEQEQAARYVFAAPLTAAHVLLANQANLNKLILRPEWHVAAAATLRAEDAQRNALEQDVLCEHEELLRDVKVRMRRAQPLGSAGALAVKDVVKMFVNAPELLRRISELITAESNARAAFVAECDAVSRNIGAAFMRGKPMSRDEALSRAAALEAENARLRAALAALQGGQTRTEAHAVRRPRNYLNPALITPSNIPRLNLDLTAADASR
jgi:hypothetical protein